MSSTTCGGRRSSRICWPRPSPVPGKGELVVSVKACGVAFPDVLIAQDKYQHKPELPYSPGGVSDIAARLVGAKLGDALGQQVIVENRPGGNATIGVGAVVKAAPDGYTYVVGTWGDFTVT